MHLLGGIDSCPQSARAAGWGSRRPWTVYAAPGGDLNDRAIVAPLDEVELSRRQSGRYRLDHGV